MADDSQDEMIKRTTVNEITAAYTAMRLNYEEYQKLLQLKAISVNNEAYGDKGYMLAARKIMIKEIQKGWDNIKEAAAWEAEAGDQGGMQRLKDELWYAGLGLVGEIQILNAVTLIGPFATATGLAAEKYALQGGASAGLAKWIGAITEFGGNFVPSAIFAKTATLGIKIAQKAAGALKGAEKGVGAVEKVIGETEGARNLIEQSLDIGLKADGVKKTVFSAAGKELEVGSQKLAARDLITTETGTVIDRATGEVIPSYMYGAQQIAAQKLGVPIDQVHDLLTGWAPEKIAAGDIEGAAAQFIREITTSPTTGLAEENPKVLKILKDTINDLKNESGTLSIPSWAQVSSVHRNAVLSFPPARLVDVISNAVASGTYMAQRTVGTLAQTPIPFTGAERATTLTGTAYYGMGLTAAWHEAFRALGSAFKMEGKGLAGQHRLGEAPLKQDIPGIGGWLINTPTMFTVGWDRFAKTLNMRAHLYATEIEDAIKTGRTFNIQNVDLPNPTAWNAAEKNSTYLSFQNELGYLGSKFQQMAQAPVLDLYFRFIKTPINLNKYTYNNAPGLQIASKRLFDEIAQGGEVADVAMGRLTLSNMFAYYIFELQKNDLITGTGPQNPVYREAWLKTHQPLSIKKPDGSWKPYPLIGPLAQVVGMITDFAQGIRDLKDPEVGQVAQAIVLAVKENLGKNSFWNNLDTITDVADAIGTSDIAYEKQKMLLTKPLVDVTVGSGASRVVKEFIDPQTREARTLVESVLSKTPWGSTTVSPKRDGMGDIILPPEVNGGQWGRAINPDKTYQVSHDELRMEAARLGVKFPNTNDRNFGGSPHSIDLKQPKEGEKVGIAFDDKTHDERVQIYQNFLHHETMGLRALMNTKEYTTGNDAYKRQLFEDHLSDTWAEAGQTTMDFHPELRSRETANEAEQYKELTNPGPERDKMQQEYRKEIDFYQSLKPGEMTNILRYTPVE